MKEIAQLWREFNPREQWLALGIGAVVLAVIYLMVLHDPTAAANKRLQTQVSAMVDRRTKAMTEMAELEAKLKADPNRVYQAQLVAAVSESERLNQELNQLTLTLVSPEKMRFVLDELLKKQGGLTIISLNSFTEAVQTGSVQEPSSNSPMALAKAIADKGKQQEPPTQTLLYRHGVKITLEGGYFDLLKYLRAVEKSGWKIFWDRLDYSVTEAPKARFEIIVFTLSREAEWIGV